jgi:hypothetical protein
LEGQAGTKMGPASVSRTVSGILSTPVIVLRKVIQRLADGLVTALPSQTATFLGLGNHLAGIVGQL